MLNENYHEREPGPPSAGEDNCIPREAHSAPDDVDKGINSIDRRLTAALTDIPDDAVDAIQVLEERFFDTLEALRQNAPDENAPPGVRIAHTLAYGRVRSDGEVISELHRERDKQKETE